MKRFAVLPAVCLCFILNGCITEYEAKKLEDTENILVVEGIITEGTSNITLSRSVSLMHAGGLSSFTYVDDAIVSVECDDGTRIIADEHTDRINGLYVIQTGELNFDRKYRLKIEIDEFDCSSVEAGVSPCASKKYEYSTNYMSPVLTPEIDSVFWTKKTRGQPVNIHVATHSPDSEVLYYRWSYKEDWEIRSDRISVAEFPYPYFCWGTLNSKSVLIGSAENTALGQLTSIIAEIDPTDRKLEVLYRIKVKQNAISKQAYDYYANIKKNTQQTANIFAPIQSELRGNITCITDPKIQVIGYVDISTSTQYQQYISNSAGIYEYNRFMDCEDVMQDSLLYNYGIIPDYYVPHHWGYDENINLRLFYIFDRCVDCTFFGTTVRPDDWPGIYY